MAKMTERLADMASSMLLTSVRVTDVSRLAERFVSVELQAEAFRSTSWTQGAKLRLRPERGTLGLRTYTPTRWDTARGATRLIAFTHGDGPATGWFRRAAVGDVCEVLGPQGSIDLRRPSGPVVFVGDESSVGLACALRTATSDVRHVFEAGDPTELTAVLTDLGITGDCAVVPRSAGREQLLERARQAGEACTEPFELVVSGDAATVHAVRRDARGWPRRPANIKARAYWAAGRTGLD